MLRECLVGPTERESTKLHVSDDVANANHQLGSWLVSMPGKGGPRKLSLFDTCSPRNYSNATHVFPFYLPLIGKSKSRFICLILTIDLNEREIIIKSKACVIVSIFFILCRI